jgi:hypothetical protein
VTAFACQKERSGAETQRVSTDDRADNEGLTETQVSEKAVRSVRVRTMSGKRNGPGNRPSRDPHDRKRTTLQRILRESVNKSGAKRLEFIFGFDCKVMKLR